MDVRAILYPFGISSCTTNSRSSIFILVPFLIGYKTIATLSLELIFRKIFFLTINNPFLPLVTHNILYAFSLKS